MIVIVDSGGANLVSISSAIERLGYEVRVSGEPKVIESAHRLILPGVGSAKTVMNRLNALSLVSLLRTTTIPLLGICVGMQVLFDYSEEGDTACLGIIKGRVKKLKATTLPHMGWNKLKPCNETTVLQGFTKESFVYYVHSFAAPISTYTIATTDYVGSFSAAVLHKNFLGVQFHPERSGAVGSHLLKNFLEQRP